MERLRERARQVLDSLPGMERLGRLIGGALPLLWSLALGIFLTWPMALRPGAAALGSANGDGMKHLWTLWWMRSSVWDEGKFPFHTLRVNYPVGMDLYPIEPLNGLVAVLLPWLDVVTLSNLLVLGNLTLTGLAAYFLGKVLTGSRIAGLVSATLLEGSAIMAFFVHVGVGELNHLWWLPLGLGCLVKAHRTGRWAWFGALSASLVGAMLSCFYLGFFLALSVLVWAICGLIRRSIELVLERSDDENQHPILRRIFSKHPAMEPLGKVLVFGKLFGQYALAAALAVAVVWPVTQSFAASYKTGDLPETTLSDYVFEDHGQPVTDPVHERLELDQLVEKDHEEAGETRSEVNHERKEEAYGGGRYIGWVALGICALGLLRRPDQAWAWVLVAGTGVLFAMGTYYTVDGVVHTVDGVPADDGGQRVQLPLLWLNRVLGYLAEPLNFPVRFLAMTSVAVAAMGALAAGSLRWPGWASRRLESLWGRLPQVPELRIRDTAVPKWSVFVLGLSTLALVDVVDGQKVERPWASFTLRPAAELEALREEPDLAVVDLALAIRSDEENRWSALATQIAHGKAMNAVPVERIEYFARDGVFFVKALQLVQDLTPLYQNIAGEGTRPGECSDGVDNDGDGMADCADQRGCERFAHCGLGGTAEDTEDSFIQYRPEGYYRGDFAILRDAGFGWIVVSYKNGSFRDPMPPDLAQALDERMGPAVVEGSGLGAWEIPEVEYTADELAGWKEEHQAKIVILEAMTPGMGPQRPMGPPPPRMEAPSDPPPRR